MDETLTTARQAMEYRREPEKLLEDFAKKVSSYPKWCQKVVLCLILVGFAFIFILFLLYITREVKQVIIVNNLNPIVLDVDKGCFLFWEKEKKSVGDIDYWLEGGMFFLRSYPETRGHIQIMYQCNSWNVRHIIVVPGSVESSPSGITSKNRILLTSDSTPHIPSEDSQKCSSDQKTTTKNNEYSDQSSNPQYKHTFSQHKDRFNLDKSVDPWNVVLGIITLITFLFLVILGICGCVGCWCCTTFLKKC